MDGRLLQTFTRNVPSDYTCRNPASNHVYVMTPTGRTPQGTLRRRLAKRLRVTLWRSCRESQELNHSPYLRRSSRELSEPQLSQGQDADWPDRSALDPRASASLWRHRGNS
jgi:hypothetical protein